MTSNEKFSRIVTALAQLSIDSERLAVEAKDVGSLSPRETGEFTKKVIDLLILSVEIREEASDWLDEVVLVEIARLKGASKS